MMLWRSGVSFETDDDEDDNGFFLACEDLGRNVQPFIPRLRFFFFFF